MLCTDSHRVTRAVTGVLIRKRRLITILLQYIVTQQCPLNVYLCIRRAWTVTDCLRLDFGLGPDLQGTGVCFSFFFYILFFCHVC